LTPIGQKRKDVFEPFLVSTPLPDFSGARLLVEINDFVFFAGKQM
jgi:hypothetical protein